MLPVTPSPLVASPLTAILTASMIAWMVSGDKGSALCTQCRGRQSGRVCWGHGGGGVLGHHHLRVGSIESPPLVVKNRGLVLPLNPSPGHRVQLIDALPQAGVECLLEVVDQPDIS